MRTVSAGEYPERPGGVRDDVGKAADHVTEHCRLQLVGRVDDQLHVHPTEAHPEQSQVTEWAQRFVDGHPATIDGRTEPVA